MCTDKEKKIFVDSILKSSIFKDSPVYKTLLLYLVESNLSKNIPKETAIAIDVFGKHSDYNSNKDSTVRYHVHMLRNKLIAYYRNEGKADKIRLVIPKGHYQIEFTHRDRPRIVLMNRIVSFFKRWESVVIFLLLFVNLALIISQIHYRRSVSVVVAPVSVDPQDKIWGPFFENKLPVSIVLGDDFMLDEYSAEYGRYRQIRDWEIYSENDLVEFLKHYPKANVWMSEITGIPFGGIDNLMDVLPVLYQFQSDVSLQLSSRLSLEAIRNRNILYIGEFANLRILEKILFTTPIRYQYRPDERLFILDDRGDTLKSFLRVEAPYAQKDKYNVDYSLLIKIPGFEKENMMFVVGFGYGGRLERTKILGDSKRRMAFVDAVQKINGSVPEYFIALFEVKSIERTGFTDAIKYFKPISRDFFKLNHLP